MKKDNVKIITVGSLLKDLKRFEKILNENIAKGFVSIEEKDLSGIEDIAFEI